MYSDNTPNTDKHTKKKLQQFYTEVIEPRDIKRILLIGVDYFGGGDIVEMRRVFPDAYIATYDTSYFCIWYKNRKVLQHIHTYQIDAYNSVPSELFDEKFDLIVDDAIHELDYQKLLYEKYIKFLKKDGIYIIEDLPVADAAYADKFSPRPTPVIDPLPFGSFAYYINDNDETPITVESPPSAVVKPAENPFLPIHNL